MSSQILIIIYSMTAGLLGALGDGLLSNGTKAPLVDRYWWYFSGFLVWNASLWLFVQVLKKGDLLDSVLLFVIANSIVVVLLSQFVFREQISVQKWIAVALGFIVVIVLSKH